MPKSKHRRKNVNRPRPRNVTPPPRNPEPSAPWVPIVGVGLLIAAVVLILVGYLEPVQVHVTSNLPPFRTNWPLVGGFMLFLAGFGFLIRWR